MRSENGNYARSAGFTLYVNTDVERTENTKHDSTGSSNYKSVDHVDAVAAGSIDHVDAADDESADHTNRTNAGNENPDHSIGDGESGDSSATPDNGDVSDSSAAPDNGDTSDSPAAPDSGDDTDNSVSPDKEDISDNSAAPDNGNILDNPARCDKGDVSDSSAAVDNEDASDSSDEPGTDNVGAADVRSVSEKDLRPLIQNIVQADWTWDANNDYRNYIGIDGWVHYSKDAGGTETTTPFPQEGGEQGELDRQLLQDVAKEMAKPVNAAQIKADAGSYAEEKYMATHPASSGYQQDMREYLQTMSSIVLTAGEKMSEEARGRLKTAVGSVEEAMGNLASAGGEVKSLFDTVNGMPDLQMPQLGSEYRSIAGSLNTNLQGLSENMGQLNQEMSSGSDVMLDDLAAINDQFSMIMRLYTDAIDGVLDMDYEAVYEDTSQEDAESSTEATIADCTNRGTVQGDLNVSGIAGTMAIEYDFDLEGDVTGIDNARLNSTFLTRCVLRNNVNEGNVTAQKSYAGGIAGLQEMGTVLCCENYGRISSTAGNYVGGIAGKSLSHITNGYAKCTVSGETYAAGIAGFGSSMENCCAMVRVQDASSFYGAIAGDVDHSGIVANNRFVSEEIAGIDRISYSGKAEPVSYEELLTVPGLPARFQMMSVVFYADEEEVKRLQCPYKSDVSAKLYPDIPARDGFYADWDIREIPGILYDEDVTAEYVRYLTTLASAQTRENGQSILLADGMFKQEAELVIADAGNAAEKTTPEDVTECWHITIPEDGNEQHQIRYQAPQGETEGVSVYRKQNDGTWLQMDTELMGIYHLFTVEGTEAEIAVCIQNRRLQAYLVYGIPAVLVATAVIAFFVGKSRKRKKGKVLVSDVVE